MTGTIKAPVELEPTTGDETTVLTVTWATYDVKAHIQKTSNGTSATSSPLTSIVVS